MPHFRARVEGMTMEDVDAAMREARAGAVISGDVSNQANASGTPGPGPVVRSVSVTVEADSPDDARRRLEETLPAATSIDVSG